MVEEGMRRGYADDENNEDPVLEIPSVNASSMFVELFLTVSV
jgi:hypothetical protein